MESEAGTSNKQIPFRLAPATPSILPALSRPSCAMRGGHGTSREEVNQGLKILVSVHEKMADMP